MLSMRKALPRVAVFSDLEGPGGLDSKLVLIDLEGRHAWRA
jgi:hypothetical protein